MKVAALERFSDPSRRCDAALIGNATDEVRVWNLPNPLREPWTFLREVPGGLASWFAPHMSMRSVALSQNASRSTRGTGGR